MIGGDTSQTLRDDVVLSLGEHVDDYDIHRLTKEWRQRLNERVFDRFGLVLKGDEVYGAADTVPPSTDELSVFIEAADFWTTAEQYRVASRAARGSEAATAQLSGTQQHPDQSLGGLGLY